MKKTSMLLLLAAALVGPALAGLPRKARQGEYSHLVSRSPFTSPAPARPLPPAADPFQDYALGGVSPVPGGYRVTLLNRKKPDERIVLPESADFKIINVRHNAADPMNTSVRLASGGTEGDVRFDQSMLTLKTAAPAPPAPAAPGALAGHRPRVAPKADTASSPLPPLPGK